MSRSVLNVHDCENVRRFAKRLPAMHHRRKDFLQKMRELSGGKPIGFKICIGRKEEFIDIVKAMKANDIYPDFITVDGAEGGTGAAPLEFIDYMGMALSDALVFTNKTLKQYGIRD